jgi:cytidylate kinase
MKREYDFAKAVRGKFYRKGAELRLPIYLDPKLQSKLQRIARRKGKDVNEIVNQWLLKDVECFEDLT